MSSSSTAQMNIISTAPLNRTEHGMYLSQAGIYENEARDRHPLVWRTGEGSRCRHIVGPILEFASPFPVGFLPFTVQALLLGRILFSAISVKQRLSAAHGGRATRSRCV